MIYHLILGSNMDNPRLQLNNAIAHILRIPGLALLRMSSRIETEPIGFVYQDKFFNQILEVECALEPQALLDTLLQIENDMGRTRHIKWGPRPIDIDILLAEDLAIETATLSLPHPELTKRDFALELLCELIPNAMHPVLHKTMQELKDMLACSGGNT